MANTHQIGIGTSGNDGTGDPLRTCFTKYNAHAHPIADVTALQTALDAKATAANPVFTGTVTVPDGALAIADTSGLQTALDTKITPTTAQIIQAATLSAGAVTCNLALGSKFAVTINAAWNAGSPLLGTNLPASGQARSIELVATISGTPTVSLSGLPWLGAAPSLSVANGAKIVLVATWEGSTLVDVVGANRA